MLGILSKAFIAAMWILLFSWIYLEGDYASTRPRVPEPSSGRTYELNVHGTTVYISKAERIILYTLFGGGVGLGLTGGLLWRASSRRTNDDSARDGSSN